MVPVIATNVIKIQKKEDLLFILFLSVIFKASVLLADYVSVWIVFVVSVSCTDKAVGVAVIVDIVKAVVQVVADWFLRRDCLQRNFACHVSKSVCIKTKCLRVCRNKFRHAGLVGVVCGLAAHFYKLIQIVIAVCLLRFVVSCHGVKAVILIPQHVAHAVKAVAYVLVCLPPLVQGLDCINPAARRLIIIFCECSVSVVYARSLSVLVVEDANLMVVFYSYKFVLYHFSFVNDISVPFTHPIFQVLHILPKIFFS